MKRLLLLAITLFCTTHTLYAEIYEKNFDSLYCKVLSKKPVTQAPLIIIHGGPGLSSGYLAPLEELDLDCTVVFYDQRGSGKSSGEISEQTLSLDAQVKDIETIRKALSCEKISILGHSWGGFLAMNYAIQHPEKIDVLILSNTMPATSDDCMLFMQEYQKKTAPYKDAIGKIVTSKAFEDKEPKAVAAYYTTVFQGYCYKPEMASHLLLEMSHDACKNGAKTFEIIRMHTLSRPYNLLSSLESLTCKTLIIHGIFDPIPYTTAERIHNAIKGSKLCLLDDCGHFPFIEKKDEYFEAIKNFINQSR